MYDPEIDIYFVYDPINISVVMNTNNISAIIAEFIVAEISKQFLGTSFRHQESIDIMTHIARQMMYSLIQADAVRYDYKTHRYEQERRIPGLDCKNYYRKYLVK